MDDTDVEIKKEVLDRFPDTKTKRYSEFLGFRASPEHLRKLELLEQHGKDRSEILREALDNYLKDVPA